MDWNKVWAIAEKDMKEAFSSISIWGPMLGIPIFFAIFLPFFTFYVSKYAGTTILPQMAGVSVNYAIGSFYFIEFFSINILGPIFMTMPIITASVLAADSFAGEKERKTAESLLLTPTTNSELLMGKILASLIPAVLLTVAVFVIYATIIDYFSIKEFGIAIFPNMSWCMMLINAPLLALTTIGLVVIVSTKVKGIKEAQQISTLLILPLLIIPFVSIFDIVQLSAGFFAGMFIILLLTSIAVVHFSEKLFDREKFIIT
ncbi:MAG: ABC transporter permease subunit [Candidatus Micrarchaeia archaeon]|jgi:ABC-type transport system involved in multi-copper enzyme maturation permease subunit